MWRHPDDGHLFLGAGGTAGERGVAIILHKDWARGLRTFKAISERLAMVDVNKDEVKLRLICVYMPHARYDDGAVEEIYSQLDRLVAEGRSSRRTVVIGGDWNAVVGVRSEGDAAEIIGNFGIGARNRRGQSMVEWATLQRLAIINTLFQKHPVNQWTYAGGEDGSAAVPSTRSIIS